MRQFAKNRAAKIALGTGENLFAGTCLVLFSDRTDDYAAAIQQRVQPAQFFLARFAGNKNHAVCPLLDQFQRIVHAVGIRQTVPFGDPVALAARSKVVERSPHSGFMKEQLDQACRHRTLPEAIAVAHEYGFPRHT